MAKKDLKRPEYYINRELSWLEFNDRVLREGLNLEVPLMERLKFLAIVSSNLDEFFMIRVAGLMQQRSARIRRRDPSGLTPNQQILAISARAHRLVDEQTEGIHDAIGRLGEHGLHVLDPGDWTGEQRRFLRGHFQSEIQPVLTPIAVQDLEPCPLLQALQLNVAALVSLPGEQRSRRTVIAVPVPRQLPRFITIPAAEGLHVARLEDVIAANLPLLLPEAEVLATAAFRITRDADVDIQEDEAPDLLHAVEEAVRERRRRAAVRLEIAARADHHIRRWLVAWLGLRAEDVYDIDGMLDAAALMELVNRRGFESLRDPEWPPQTPRKLLGADDVFEEMLKQDILLFHPYEKFDPVVEMVSRAADDPSVLAIKMTMYRTSGDSPIIDALERAAAAGKQVVALVELKARFDEARNVGWARRLEDAGCHVIYGIAGLKTHAKALLVVRRDAARVRRYVHLATGNYNDKTAKLYSDLGLMTTDREIAGDVAALFNMLVGLSEPVGWSHVTIAPTELRRRFEELIDREIQTSTPDRPGLILAKTNSLEDPGIIRALYRASRAGVRVRLNVRGICCLRPGVKGVSENIEVRSIVDRYLEHARIFYFRNGGHQEMYLSSGDWMRRNLDRRVELLFPVRDTGIVRRIRDILDTFFADNVKAWELQADGTYARAAGGSKRIRAQEAFHEEAVEAAHGSGAAPLRFRPLTRPEE